MRIALLPSSYAPFVGGVEEVARHLARQLATGDEVEVWAPMVGKQPATEVLDGVRVRRIPMPLPPARLGPIARFPFEAIPAAAKLREAARHFRPDVLHVQCFSANGAYATAVAALLGIPLVVSLQGETVMDDHDIFEHSVTLRTCLRIALGRAAAVTACSAFVLDDAIARFGLTPAKGQVIFNAVDLSEPIGTWDGAPLERFILGLGRLVWKKGFDLLIDAFADVAGEVPDVGLVVAGGGPLRPVLERQVRDLGLQGRVHFTETLDRLGVGAAMRAAEVLVMPSRTEPFGIVVLEGWRAGCPVIATAVGGPPEFVHDGVDGLTVDPHDKAALSTALVRLLGDEALRLSLAAMGRQRVDEFDWPVVASRYREVYERVRPSSDQELRRPLRIRRAGR